MSNYGSSINPPSILKRNADGKLVPAYVAPKKKKKPIKKIRKRVINKEIPDQVIGWANEHRINPTIHEKEVIDWLSHYGINFEFQKPIFANNKYYILDFHIQYGKRKVCIEVDGNSHFTKEGKKKDRVRDKALKSIGYTIIRISNYDVSKSPETVIGLLGFIGIK